MLRRAPNSDPPAGGRLALSTEFVSWGEGGGAPVAVSVYSDTPWRVAGAPWWVRVVREGDALVLTPRVAGPLKGSLKVVAGGSAARVRLLPAPAAPRPLPWLARVAAALAVGGVAAHHLVAAIPGGWPQLLDWAASLAVPGLAIGLALALPVAGWALAPRAVLGAIVGYYAATFVATQTARAFFALGVPLAFPWSYLGIGAAAFWCFGYAAGWPLGGQRFAVGSAWRAALAGLLGIGIHMGLVRLGWGWGIGPVMIPASLWVLAMAWLLPPAAPLAKRAAS